MARLRSGTSKVTSTTTRQVPSNDADSLTDTPATSFNGAIKQFEFSEATSASVIKSTVTRKRVSKVTKSSTSNGVTKTQKRSKSSKYAPPEKYAHLNGIPDAITPNLLCLLVGHNPGVKTAQNGHAYSHPSNLYWKLLHSSGLTPDRRVPPEEDQTLPALYSLGHTNIVSRPTKDTAELSLEEQAGGTPILEAKVREYRPESVCCVGKSIWEAIWRHRFGKNPKKDEFKYGWQDERHNMGAIPGEWKGARVFVATTSSGLAASMKLVEKEAIWKELGDWVQQRRKERSEAS